MQVSRPFREHLGASGSLEPLAGGRGAAHRAPGDYTSEAGLVNPNRARSMLNAYPT